MLWFFLAILGYFLLATVFIMDKFILSGSVDAPVVYTFYSTIFMFGAFLLWPFGVDLIGGYDLMIAVLSGISFGFGLWMFFIAVQKGEASHISPFMGAMITISSFVIAGFFLQERLSGIHIIGVVLLALASLLLSFERTRRHNGFHIGFLWAIGAGIGIAVSTVTAKYIFEHHTFLTGLVWTKGTTGFVGVLALLSPTLWKSWKKSSKKQHNKSKKMQSAKTTAIIIVIDKILAIGGNVFVQLGIALGSVTLVNALSGIQFALMFVMIILLTKFVPKLFKEYFTKRELVIQSIAITLVVIGSALFAI